MNLGVVLFAVFAVVVWVSLAGWLALIVHRQANELLDEDDERRAGLFAEALNEDENRRGDAP